MPRTPRPPETVDAFRQEILDAALKLIVENGFESLSMRKIASRLGVTATTIYNYYASKDEIYFYMRIRGFELLYECLEQACSSHHNPAASLQSAVEEYLRFGFRHPDYYEVMFLSRTVPKFLDCAGTPLEGVARREKDTSMRPLYLIAEAIAGHPDVDRDDARYLTIQLWTEVNGIVSLRNSRLLREVEDDVDGLVARLASDICAKFCE